VLLPCDMRRERIVCFFSPSQDLLIIIFLHWNFLVIRIGLLLVDQFKMAATTGRSSVKMYSNQNSTPSSILKETIFCSCFL